MLQAVLDEAGPRSGRGHGWRRDVALRVLRGRAYLQSGFPEGLLFQTRATLTSV